MVGRELVPLFLKNDDWEIYLLIHDQGESLKAESLLETLFGLPLDSNLVKRIHVITGDITQEDLGISDLAFTNKITHIIHAAATTRFDLPLEEARRINVKGTANALQLAKRCDNLKQFGFLSTAYVSGKRIGKIYEKERVHHDGFVNSYEQSKYEAEGLIETAEPDVPTATYRLSTILGDSKTGKVLHFTAPHQSLRIMYLGLASMVPGTPDYLVDLIPSDYAALTLFELFSKRFKAGQVFHITAGKKKSYTLKELIDESFRYLGELDPQWQSRQYPKPVIASAEAFELFLRSVKDADNHLLRGVVSALGNFAHQLNYPKEFDIANLSVSLPKYEKNLPDVREYYSKVVQYCLKTNWGKHA